MADLFNYCNCISLCLKYNMVQVKLLSCPLCCGECKAPESTTETTWQIGRLGFIFEMVQVEHAFQDWTLPLRFVAEQILNLDVKNDVLVLSGRIGQNPSPERAVMIAKPKVQVSLDVNKLTNLQRTFSNDIYSTYIADLPSKWELKLVYPSTDKHLKKYTKKRRTLTKQTKEDYQKKDLTHEIGHNQWVYNILEGKAQVERVVYREEGQEGFLLIPDSENGNSSEDMHYLAIVNDRSLWSIRNLSTKHVDLLKRIRAKIKEVLTQKYGAQHSYREYFHYPPTFYHLHIHFTSLEIEGPSTQIERCHQLSQVIHNLQLDSDYYKSGTLNVVKDVPI